MCDYKIWYQPCGDVYVLQCTECNTYQVRLYGAAFIFEPPEFGKFREIVNEYNTKIEAGINKGPIIITTFNHGLDLLLNETRLKELHFLLEAADTEIKAAQIRHLFN